MLEMHGFKIGALILSAGRSSRQSGFKPILPIGPMTVLEHCIRLFTESGIGAVQVVLGHRAEELLPIIEKTGAHPVINQEYDRGMFSSVQIGLAALPADIAGFFVLPVDIPLVRPITLEILVDCFSRNPNTEAFLPGFAGRTGHPPLLRENLRRDIAAYDGGKGLRGVLERCGTTVVSVPDRHILEDMDTPEQYIKIVDFWQRRDIPTPDEAEILLLRECRDNEDNVRHSRSVAQVAKKLAEAVNESGASTIDTQLVVAAALLHDIAKGQADHCRAGASRLKALGFSDQLAEIVACHADYEPVPGTAVNETELVYLADKLVRETKTVRLDTRFQTKYDRLAGNEQARQSVLRRWRQARMISDRIEKSINCRMTSLL